jgi:hypothetical protein
MAHECPECGMLCHCHGDIDDIMLDTEESYLNCDHYLECQDEDDWDDEDDVWEKP